MLQDTVVDCPIPKPTPTARPLPRRSTTLGARSRRALATFAQALCHILGAYAGLGAMGLAVSQLSGSLGLGTLWACSYGAVAALALGRLLLSLRQPPRKRALAPVEHEFAVTATRIELHPAGASAARFG